MTLNDLIQAATRLSYTLSGGDVPILVNGKEAVISLMLGDSNTPMVEMNINFRAKETSTPEQAMQSLDEKVKAAKKSWEGIDADKFMDEVRGREESVTDCNGEAFDTEVYLYCQNHFEELTSDRPTQQMVAAIARHFAKWVAEQGESVEGEVVKDITNRLAVTAKGIVGKGWHFGDKVIVQIRKK